MRRALQVTCERLLPPLQYNTISRTLLVAALLHDVGHYPFSHAIEELGYPVVPHERVGRRLIETSSIADVLERHGLTPAESPIWWIHHGIARSGT